MPDTSTFTLSALLARSAAAHPDAPAASDDRECLSFAELERRSMRHAHRLSRLGIGFGDAVAFWMPNSVDYLGAIFGAARLGAVAIHINTRFRAREAGDLLRRSAARVLVTDFRFAPVDFAGILAEIADTDLAGLKTIATPDPDGPACVRGLPVVDLRADEGEAEDAATPDAPCLTFTTSGTTAAPKLVLHAQRSIARHAGEVASAIGLAGGERAALAIMPLCGTFGSAFVMAAVAGGAHTVLMDRFDTERAVALVRRHRVSHLATTDDVLRRMADEAGAWRLETIRFSGFASFSPGAVENIRVAAGAGLQPRGLYGSSEGQAFFAIAPPDDALRDGGVPVSAEATIAVRDVETGAPLADGEEGELCLSGPSMFEGYWGNEEATARARTADGLFRSGDVVTAKGARIYFHHRLGDSLRLGGFLVDPAEIEAVLVAHGAGGAQVVGIDHLGKHVAVAFVTPGTGGADAAALAAVCRRDLATHKMPTKVIMVEAFPLTDSPNGQKIQKARLRDMAREAMADADSFSRSAGEVALRMQGG